MYKVAIIDDESEILDMLGRFLGRKHNVDVYENPLEALKKLNEINYDIVLCDIMMPHMTGLDLLKELRQSNNNTKVIMMTAFDTMDKAFIAHEYGAKHYIKKPFNSLKDVEDKMLSVIEE